MLLFHPFGLPPESKRGGKLVLQDFCDGTLLCDLVAKLQHRVGLPLPGTRSYFGANSRGCLQGKLSGVTRDGKSRACAAHNVEKSLVLLRDDGRVQGTYLWANDSIIEVR